MTSLLWCKKASTEVIVNNTYKEAMKKETVTVYRLVIGNEKESKCSHEPVGLYMYSKNNRESINDVYTQCMNRSKSIYHQWTLLSLPPGPVSVRGGEEKQ